ncbi:MAG: response regulator transcription factor [Clostridiales bacterium]|nr:response regulator transcription factor [Clostridiales bacterium]
MAKLLIWEPDEQIARKIQDFLKKDAHEICRMDETAALPSQEEQPTLVIMDARMRWSDCRPLLEACCKQNLPLLFLTADKRASAHAHLKALYNGRCEVTTLPLQAKALRSKLTQLCGVEEGNRELQVDEEERVALLDGRRVELTAQETALLLALMEKPDTPVSREQLLRKAWGYQSIGETRTVDVHVQRLRKKLGCEYIETVYKCGYRLRLA